MKQKYQSKVWFGCVLFCIILGFMVETTSAEVFGTFELVPEEAFESAGQVGGPFAPASKTYQVTNTGAGAAV